MSSHYLFDEDEEFIEHFDYRCDWEIHENYELVHSVNSDFKFTQEQWNDLFRRLIEKAEFKQACIEALKKPIIKEKVIIKNKDSVTGEITEKEVERVRNAWDENCYAQILGALIKYNLISQSSAYELNKELKKIHGVDIIEIYNKYYK